MNCPRCGGRLTRYRLGERQAVGCDECAYVGISVDHTAEHGPPESWDDAIDRFNAEGQTVAIVTRDDMPPELPVAELPEEETLVNGVDDELVETDLVVPVFDEADADEGTTTADAGD